METKHKVLPLDIESELKKSFIAYSMAVITSRALPDVRDGLKPVHRRILYAMDELGMQSDKPYRKSARIVGDVLGKYHPHGDSSVYDALVRLAQPFNIRYPLVDGQGNFGNVDGDGAAAMRYTEARMSRLCNVLLQDIDRDTVDFTPNFDETLMQPTVLPSRYPNLLVNGSAGIAVGMASNMPPHNMGEVIDAYVALIDNPDISVEELMNYVPGPDFPTGGIIMGTAGIRQAYRTGRGKLIVRAKTEIEEFGNGRRRIVVTELPYQVNKSRLVEKMAELVRDKRIEGISDIRDESSRHGMRVAIDLKKDVSESVVLNLLYKHTPLQDTFGVINLALVDGEPKVLDLKSLLYHYLKFQEEVVTRRTRYDLEKARERLHILEGLIIAQDNIDEIVELIKRAPSPAEAKLRLLARFPLSERQAQAILDMRLARLTGLEREKILAERAELMGLVERYLEILGDEKLLLKVIRDEILEVRERYADARRTEITQVFDDIDMDDIIEVEQMVVTMTNAGYIKRTSADTYRAQRRGGLGVMGQGTREEDFVTRLFTASTHDQILYFTNLGRALRMKCYVIPEASRTARGTAIVNLLQLQNGERVTALFPISTATDDDFLVMATKQGIIKKTQLVEFKNIRKGGIIAQSLREGDELINAMLSSGDDEFLVGTRNGRCIRFHESQVRPVGRTAAGVRSIILEGDDVVVDTELIIKGAEVLSITEGGIGKRTNEEQYRCQNRGGKGVIASALNERTGKLICMEVVRGDEDVILIRDDGVIIRLPVEQISVTGRNTRGVKVMRVDAGTRVVSATLAEHTEDAESAETDAEPVN